MEKAAIRDHEKRIEAGDENSLVALWESGHLSYPIKIAERINNPTDREDVEQEAFLNTLKAVRAKKFKRKRGSFSGWTKAIASNVSVDFCRRSKTRSDTVSEFVSDIAPLKSHATAVDFPLDDSIVQEILATLPKRDVEVLRLIYITGMSIPCVASYYNMPVGTVKSWIFRIKEKIRLLIAQRIGEQEVADTGLWRKAV